MTRILAALLFICLTGLVFYSPLTLRASEKAVFNDRIAQNDATEQKPETGDTAANDSTAEKKEENKEEAKPIMAGRYLAGRFAQLKHDWAHASEFIIPLLSSGMPQQDIMQRAMIIAMGSGRVDKALSLAHRAQEIYPDVSNTIADVFLFTQAFKAKDYETALAIFDAMNPDATQAFIGPFLKGWLSAALGEVAVKHLQNNSVQLYHGILISDYLDHHEDVEEMIDKATKVEDVTLAEAERIADLYAHVGLKDKALKMYRTIIQETPNNDILAAKIKSVEEDNFEPLFDKVNSPQEGLAMAYYDISRILYTEHNSESARVFAHLAKYLSPELSQPNFLLAEINAQYKQYARAIEFYSDIPANDQNYMQAQHEIVNIYDHTKQYDKAVSLLKTLVEKEETPAALIRLGDLYRHQDNFKKAISIYDRAVATMNENVPDKYWHVYYVRGIAHEQSDNWEAAEQDLKKALTYRPDHPYVLNYLGYSWADQGINLDEAARMIRRAVEARPSDGYITDSLGWVLYRNGDYEQAVKILERAVELLPYDPTINDHLGDAYWKVGRRLEASFQWERAKNHSEDEKQIEVISRKLSSGLVDDKKAKDEKGVISH
ncbi:MAG: tetratricopeptide repeat protein [Alphaproteobacteria bacterium]